MPSDPDQARGFTLLEMTVVLGVIAILLLMALPSDTDKIVRDPVAEALPLADVAKGPNRADVPAAYLPFRCRAS